VLLRPLEIREKAIKYSFEIYNKTTGALSATVHIVAVCVELENEKLKSTRCPRTSSKHEEASPTTHKAIKLKNQRNKNQQAAVAQRESARLKTAPGRRRDPRGPLTGGPGFRLEAAHKSRRPHQPLSSAVSVVDSCVFPPEFYVRSLVDGLSLAERGAVYTCSVLRSKGRIPSLI